MDLVDLVDEEAGLEGDDGNADAARQLQLVEQELAQVEHEVEVLLARQAALQAEREQLTRAIAVERRAPRADWAGAFPWDATVRQLLGSVFALRDFRPLQREVINATLQGRDVLCLMPSGGGKSLCYQLPALMGGSGLTLVVSPLLSLIQDQVRGLEALGVHAAALTSLTRKEDAAAISKQVEDASSSPRLLFVTPEKIVNSKRFFSKLEKVYKQGRLDRIAVDEAHCCSQWGNDFRTDYKRLAILRQQFPDTPILALTATATQQVCQEVRSILHIEASELFRSSINRPNLYYEVVQKPATAAELVADIARWISMHYPNGESGIVYVLTRKDAETLAEELRGAGLRCGAYHADMEPAQRERVHSQWSAGRLQVITATIAFGMGINNPHVRFVVHHTISKAVENYYQESGRAGRDGLPAHCRLYYRFADYMRQATVVTMEYNWEAHLKGMLRYAASTTCRRAQLCKHFGEAPARCAAGCDVCRRQQAASEANATGAAAGGAGAAAAAAAAGGAAAAAAGRGAAAAAGGAAQEKNVTEAAKGAVQTLQAWPGAEKRATLIQLIDKWRGSKDSAVAKAAKVLSRDECEAVLQQLVLLGLLRLDFGFTAYATNCYLTTTQQANRLLQGKVRVCIPATTKSSSHAGSPAHKPAAGAEAALQRERSQQLAARGGGRQDVAQQHQQQQQQQDPRSAAADAAQRRAAAQAAAAPAAGALEAARQQLAAEHGTIAGAVLTDDQLRQLAAQRPATQRQLAALLGPEKTELYGAALLAALLQTGQAALGEGRGGSGSNGGGAAAAGAQQQQQVQGEQTHAQQQQQQHEGDEGQELAAQQQYPARGKLQQAGSWPAKQARKAEVVVLDSSDDDEAFVPAPAAARGPKRGKR